MSLALELWRALEAWDPDRHPRGPGGKFIKGLGGGGRKHSLADAVNGTASAGPKRQRKDKAGMSVADAVRKAARTSDTTGRPTRHTDAEHRAHGAHDVADEVERALDDAGAPDWVRKVVTERSRARADSHGPRPDTLGKRPSPKVAADAPGGVDAAKADIRQAVGEIAPRGEWVGLADLRDRLGDRHSRADVDEALDSLVDDPDVRIIPVANTKALSDRDRRAAVQIGGEDSHAIMLTATPATKAPAPAASGAEVRQQRVSTAKADVRSAVGRLQSGPGEWVGLARLRDDLGEKHNRHVVDDALKDLEREPDVNIVPESNRKTLTAADHDSAVRIGNQDKHLIAIDSKIGGGSAAPAPASDGLDRYRTSEDDYRKHYDGFTDDQLASAGRVEGVPTEGRSRAGIVSDLAAARAREDRKVLEQNLAERQAGSGAGSVQTRPAGAGGSTERTEITGAWKGGRSSGGATAPAPAAVTRDAKAKPDRTPTKAELDADALARQRQGGLGSGRETGKQAWGQLLSGPQKDAPKPKAARTPEQDAADRKAILDKTAAALSGGAPKRGNVFANPEFNASTGRSATTPAGADAARAESVQRLAGALRTAKSRDAARAAIADRNVRELRALAEHLGVKPGAKATKPKLLDAIVDGTAGRRLDSEALGRH